MIETDRFLCHHGVKGQKWGIRRAAAELGHPETQGKAQKNRDPSTMTDEELRTYNNRAQLENTYRENLRREQERGRGLLATISNKVYNRAVAQLSQKIGDEIASQLFTRGKKALGAIISRAGNNNNNNNNGGGRRRRHGNNSGS